jgi:hypothetical protein
MKRFSFKFFLFFLVLYFGAAATVQAAQRMSARTLQAPKTVQYIQVKPEFKNLTIAPMTVDSVVDELQGIVVLCSTATPDAARRLPPDSNKMLVSVIQLLREEKTDKAKQTWQRLITSLKDTTAPVDINALVYWVGRQAYLKSQENLLYNGGSVGFYHTQENNLKDRLAENRRLVKACNSKEDCPTWLAAQIQQDIKMLGNNLGQVRNRRRAAQASLAKSTQKSSQTMQTLSNVAKMLHDTAKAMIQNMR